jgi:flagellar biosynthetic protein FliR
MSHAAPLVVFLLVFARISAAIVAAPVLSDGGVPAQIKIGLSAFVALLLTPDQVGRTHPISSDPVAFVMLMGEQIALGLGFALAFVAIFRAAEMAGELIGQQMGLTLGGWLRPDTSEDMHTLAQLYHILAAVIFLGLGGLQWVVLGLGQSLVAMPVTSVTLSPALAQSLLPLGSAALQFAVGLALPLLVTLLVADLITGLLGRAMPALNMLVLGLPFKMALGLAALLVAAPFTVAEIAQIMRQLPLVTPWH